MAHIALSKLALAGSDMWSLGRGGFGVRRTYLNQERQPTICHNQVKLPSRAANSPFCDANFLDSDANHPESTAFRHETGQVGVKTSNVGGNLGDAVSSLGQASESQRNALAEILPIFLKAEGSALLAVCD
jgi:hypothetical protein